MENVNPKVKTVIHIFQYFKLQIAKNIQSNDNVFKNI